MTQVHPVMIADETVKNGRLQPSAEMLEQHQLDCSSQAKIALTHLGGIVPSVGFSPLIPQRHVISEDRDCTMVRCGLMPAQNASRLLNGLVNRRLRPGGSGCGFKPPATASIAAAFNSIMTLLGEQS